MGRVCMVRDLEAGLVIGRVCHGPSFFTGRDVPESVLYFFLNLFLSSRFSRGITIYFTNESFCYFDTRIQFNLKVTFINIFLIKYRTKSNIYMEPNNKYIKTRKCMGKLNLIQF